MLDLRRAALCLDDEQQGPRRARGTGAMLSCAAPCCTWRASTVPTRKAPTLSGATYDNATSPPVAGRVPGRRGDARSHGRPAGPVVPAAPEHATTARVARVLGVGCLCERGPALHAQGALQRGHVGFQFGYLSTCSARRSVT